MADPFRDRLYSAAEVRRIVRRAAEIADDDPVAASDGRSLSLDEIERIAAELALPPRAVAMAAASPDAPARGARAAKGTGILGGPTRIVLEKEVIGEPSEADCEDIVESIRRLGENGAIERVGKTFMWSSTPGYQGRGRQLSVRLRSRDGRTRIVVEENLTRQATGLFVGLGVGAGVGPLAGYILAIVKLGVVGVLVPLLWIPMVLLIARTIFAYAAARKQRALEELMTKLTQDAARWSEVLPTGPRVAAASAPQARIAEAAEAAEEEAEASPPGARATR